MIDVLKKQGKSGRIRIICNDLIPETIEALRDNLVDFTIVQNPQQQGYRSLRILYDLNFMGKQPDSEHYYTDTHIFMQEIL